MVDPVAMPPRAVGRVYADKLNQAAWREKMLTEVLGKVRTVSASPGSAAMPPGHDKGGLVDIYV